MKAMLEVDEHHWWYRGRRRIVRAELDRLPLPAGARVLDAGCGSGRTLQELTGYGEVSGHRARPRRGRGGRARGDTARSGSAGSRSCPGRTARFDLITCLDVIEHTPDDRVTLTELRRVARPGGWLLVTVPAYQALWSLHDEANHHYRRYGRRALRRAAVETGWRVHRMTSFNSILLPPAAVVRLAQRRRQPDDGYTPQLELGPAWLNEVLERPLRARGAVAGARPDAPGRAVAAGRAREPRAGP